MSVPTDRLPPSFLPAMSTIVITNHRLRSNSMFAVRSGCSSMAGYLALVFLVNCGLNIQPLTIHAADPVPPSPAATFITDEPGFRGT